MPKLVAIDLGEIGRRGTSTEHSKRERDAIPHYPDCGCAVHSNCLTCPLPECRDVDPKGYQQFIRERREKQIVEAVLNEGMTVAHVAKRYRRSDRAIYRILSEHRRCPKCGGTNNRLVYTERVPGSVNRSFHCRNCEHRWRPTNHEAP